MISFILFLVSCAPTGTESRAERTTAMTPEVSARLAPYLRALEAPSPGAAPNAELVRLLSAYAPRIWWHSKEPYGATDPMEFIRRSSLWRRSRWGNETELETTGQVKARMLGGLREADSQRLFLKYEGPESRQSAENDRRPAAQQPDAPVLWRMSEHPALQKLRARADGRSWVMIEYWYHSPFNWARGKTRLGDHQGDWEGAAWLLELSVAADGSLAHRPLAAYYAKHDDGAWYCPRELKWTEADGDGVKHPEAFSAIGSHATYPDVGEHRTLWLTDRTERGQAWDTWKRMRSLVNEPYYGFQGHWGDESILPFSAGPRVPGAFGKSLPKGTLEGEEKAIRQVASRCGFVVDPVMHAENAR